MGIAGLWKDKQFKRRPILLGKAAVSLSTKQLLRQIEAKQIVVIQHEDVDEVAATGLIEAKVKAVINAAQTMTGKFPSKGPLLLLKAGIPIFEISPCDFRWFTDGMQLMLNEHAILLHERTVHYERFTLKHWETMYKRGQNNLSGELGKFIENTLYYAQREINFVIDPLPLPEIKTPIAGRHVVVVVRGSGYKNDLAAIKAYIEDYRPVLIGVDGGADALLQGGFQPHIIIGDMDSVSDHALTCGAEIIVHAYPDGSAPGWSRLEELKLSGSTIAAVGTSEDVAMLMAYEQNAEMIVTLGTHTHLIDFLEKGRKGMGSTILVRMKIGPKLVDAKGVSKLYRRALNWRSIFALTAAGLFPLAMLAVIHPGVRKYLQMVWQYAAITM